MNDKIYKIKNEEAKGNTFRVQCPAKINLTLKVTGKRPDGYHNIESVMQTIDLFDYLNIDVSDNSCGNEIILSGNSDEIPYNEKNLVYKATELFLSETGLKNYKISIYIEKNIPVSAGLAGGSTDATGVLYGLNEYFKKPLSDEKLHELCAKSGSDLNVCLLGGRVKTSGRGEIVEPLEFEKFDVSLIKPVNLGISAKEAYTKFSEKKKTPPTLTLPLKGGGNEESYYTNGNEESPQVNRNEEPHHSNGNDLTCNGGGNTLGFRHKYSNFAKEKAIELRKNLTDCEQILWQRIRKEQLGIKFRRQQAIGKYIADFVCQPKRLVVELDGGQHNESENIKKDNERTKFLENNGYTVIRIWDNDIINNIDGAVEYIKSVADSLSTRGDVGINDDKSLINPLPTRGGGLGDKEPLEILSSQQDFVNDLEWAVFDDYKELQHIKHKYPKSVMSGSGSTYYGVGFDFETESGYWISNGHKAINYGVRVC